MTNEHQRIHDELRDDLFKRQLSNSQFLDKAILTLSGAGLGFSLVVVNDVVPLTTVYHVYLLKMSWFCFGAAILSTLVSFLIGQIAIKKQLKLNYRYYILRQEDAKNEKNLWSAAIPVFSWASVISYLIAVTFVIVFVACNYKHTIDKENHHSEKSYKR